MRRPTTICKQYPNNYLCNKTLGTFIFSFLCQYPGIRKNPRKQPKKSAKTTFSRDWHNAKGDAKMSHPHHDKMMIADKNWYYNNMKKTHIIRRNQADPRKNIIHLVVRVKVPAILYQPWTCRAESVFLHTRWPKHETMTQCWFDVGPSSTTLAQHQTNIGSTSRACWAWTWGLIFHALFVPRSCRTKMKTEACLIYMTCNWRCPDENEARTQSVSSAPPPPHSRKNPSFIRCWA